MEMLIKQLGDPNFRVREMASKQLLEALKKALASESMSSVCCAVRAMTAAVKAHDEEVSKRAKDVVGKIPLFDVYSRGCQSGKGDCRSLY